MGRLRHLGVRLPAARQHWGWAGTSVPEPAVCGVLGRWLVRLLLDLFWSVAESSLRGAIGVLLIMGRELCGLYPCDGYPAGQ